jgi:hypothetical protein
MVWLSTCQGRANRSFTLFAMSKQSESRMWRVCTGTLVHYEQTVRKVDAARVYHTVPVHCS